MPGNYDDDVCNDVFNPTQQKHTDCLQDAMIAFPGPTGSLTLSILGSEKFPTSD